jgi:uncharacterized damage-inducible protein DinB
MDARIVALTQILRLNTKLFRNCLDGLTDEQAASRPTTATNSAAFVATHCTDARFYVLRLLGVDLANPLAPYVAGVRGIDDMTRQPPLDEVRQAWTAAAHALRDTLDTMTAHDLETAVPTGFPAFPGGDKSVLGALTFMVQHESYHVGQLSLLRKYAGLPAMKYD